MTWPGLALLAAVAVFFVGWVLNLVRVGRLYVGYAVVIVVAVASALAGTAIPAVRGAVASALEALFPAAGMLVVLAGLLLLVFVYLLTQVTILSNRLATLTQELAILNTRRDVAGRRDDG